MYIYIKDENIYINVIDYDYLKNRISRITKSFIRSKIILSKAKGKKIDKKENEIQGFYI